MKERLITFALAIGALALFFAMFMPQSGAKGAKITLPRTMELGPNGYGGMVEWLSGQSHPVLSFRQRFTQLPQVVPGQGNLLITTMPHSLQARHSEAQPLKDWISAGNTVLVMAALTDTPDWAMLPEYRGDLVAQLKDTIGIEFVVVKDEQEEPSKLKKEGALARAKQLVETASRLLEPERRELVSIGTHPLLTGVGSIVALSDFPASEWRSKPNSVNVILDLAKRKATNVPALWLARIGNGQLIVSGFASPLTNKMLDQGDNARFLANVVSWSVHSGGKVVVDDAHQGAVAFYDPKAFFGDVRLHRALWWLLLLWLVFVLGPSQMRPIGTNWNPVDVTSFVRATGGFLARTIRPTEAGRRALSLFFNDIRRRLQLPEDGMPVWEWLATQPNVRQEELHRLRASYARVAAGKRVDLQQLHNLLRQIATRFTGNTT